MVTGAKKDEVWKHFTEHPKKDRPHGVTDKRLEKVKPLIMRWDFFWQDVVLGHGLEFISPDELKTKDRYAYDHCEGNFWGMIVSAISSQKRG